MSFLEKRSVTSTDKMLCQIHIWPIMLNQMKYLRACLIESQRMRPAVLATTRKTSKDLVLGTYLPQLDFIPINQLLNHFNIILGGYQVPAGTIVIRNGYGMSNDPKNFLQPDQFMPERWLRYCPNKTKSHPFANIPFGHGSRLSRLFEKNSFSPFFTLFF